MPKKRKTKEVGTSGARNDEPREFQIVDLSRLAYIPRERWPENTRPYRGLILTEDQRNRFNQLSKRKIVPSRYACEETLTMLGLLDEVRSLAQSIGLWDFISTPWPTYETLTLVFLSTYTHNNAWNSLDFQLDGFPFSITFNDLNSICGFPIPPMMDRSGEERYFDADEPWTNLTTDVRTQFLNAICHPMRGDNTKSNVINHPSLRYLQRCMGYTIFGRGETAAHLHKRDNYLLYK
jgi:hypothetical protein